MTRYQALRRIGLDPLASAFVAFFNWLFNVPRNEIHVMHMVIEFDDADAPSPKQSEDRK